MSERIPSLDGLRAISIGLVLLLHLSQTINFSGIPVLGTVADHGAFGVSFFFVISGFLITWLILLEEKKYGSFSISAFYGRRALRILPPAFFYLLVVSCLTALGLAAVSRLDLVASAFFFRNLLPGHSVETGHYWSLSIEEQFYLIWPFLLLAVRSSKWRFSLLLALFAIAPVWRHFAMVLAGGAEYTNYNRLDLKYDFLVAGCMLAISRFNPKSLRWLRAPWLQNPVTALVCVTILAYDLLGPLPGVIKTFSFSIQSVCVALLMSYVIDRPLNLAGRFLSCAPMAWVGTMSYSIYIWCQIFLKLNDYPDRPYWIRHFPQDLAATFLCACFSFYCLEAPFGRLRRRLFSPKNTRAHAAASGQSAPAGISADIVPVSEPS